MSEALDPAVVRQMFIDEATRQGLVGVVPRDGARYGIRSGAADEWGNFGVGLAKHESGLRPTTVGDVGQFDGGSRGLYQLSYADAPNYGLNGGKPFTPEQLADPQTNTAAAVAIMKSLIDKSGTVQGGLGRYWGPISREGWTPGAGRDAGLPWNAWGAAPTEARTAALSAGAPRAAAAPATAALTSGARAPTLADLMAVNAEADGASRQLQQSLLGDLLLQTDQATKQKKARAAEEEQARRMALFGDVLGARV